jgi:outer membrane protein insertion porin family
MVFCRPKFFAMLRFVRFVFVFLSVSLVHQAQAQEPLSVDPALNGIFNNKYPVEYTIADIKVKGSDHFDNQLLISISGLAVGDKVSIPGTDKFSKAINNIWNQRYFSNVQIYITKLVDKSISLEIVVQERPVLSDYKILNVKKSQVEDLDGKMGLVKNRVITENTKRNATEAIIKYFKEKGFPRVAVVVKQIKDPQFDNADKLIFEVDKNGKVRVSEVNIFGNEGVSETKLKKQLKGTKEMSRFTLFPDTVKSVYGTKRYTTFKQYLNQKGFLSLSKTKEFLDPFFRFKLFSSAKFNEKKFEEDQQRIIEYYNSQGYRDARIEDHVQYYTPKGNMNIDIKVNEGRKYYFGDIKFKGNTKYPDSILAYYMGIKKGDIYNLELLETRLGKKLSLEGGNDISGLYVDDGYLFFRAEPVETGVYNDTIDYEIRITEGPQATIGNVKISGNDRTKEHVIRRELRTIPGEKFSRQDLIRSQREIANLQFFDPEKIGVNYEPNQEKGTVDLSYSVVERSSDQLELSAGWGGGIGLTGTLGVTFNNFSLKNIFKKSSWSPLPTGDGQKLSLRYQANGRFFHSYNFSFTEPWLGGKKRNSFTFSVFNTTYRNAVGQFGGLDKARGDTSYLKTLGVTIALGKQLRWPDDFFSLVYSLNYTRYKLRNYDNLFNLGNGQSLNNETSNNINLKVALNRSSVNQPTFPSSGSNFTLSAQLTPPYSLLGIKTSNPYRLVEYHKWRFNGEWYVGLGGKKGADGRQFVLKLAAKYGFIGKYSKDREISPFERFQVGDAGLTNNFGILGYDIIAHRGYPIYETSNPRQNPDINQPREFFTIFNKYIAELRYPFSTNPNSTIYGLAFFEAANGWYKFKDYNPFQLRRSVGVGMRFFLPMFGLLGFDYGVGLDRFGPGQNGLKGAAKFTFMLGFEPE